MAKNQMAVKEESAMVMVQDDVPDYIKNEQRGSENVGQEDIVIPRLEIVQALSPAMKEGDPGYIPEARAGMLMHSVTKQLYGKEVVVIPVIYMKQHLVWKARKDKQGKALEGGFFGAYNSEQEARERAEAEALGEARPHAVDGGTGNGTAQVDIDRCRHRGCGRGYQGHEADSRESGIQSHCLSPTVTRHCDPRAMRGRFIPAVLAEQTLAR